MKGCGLPLTMLGVASAAALCIPVQASATPLNEQTPVRVKLLQPLKSGKDRSGDQVRFEITEDIKAADQSILVPKGTPVMGKVTRSSGRKMFGQPGKLEFTIEYIKVNDQLRVPLRSSATAVRGRNNAAAAITTAVLLAPIAVFVKGREVTVKEGTEYTVFVDQTTDIPPAGMQVASGAGSSPKYDKDHLSLIKFKNGDSVTGTVCGFKDGVYFVVTETAEMSINQDQIESISEKK